MREKDEKEMIYILLEGNDKYKLIETTLQNLRREPWTEFSYYNSSFTSLLSIGERFMFIASDSSYANQMLPKADCIIYCNAKSEIKMDLENKRDKTRCTSIDLNSGEHDLRFYIPNFYSPKIVPSLEYSQKKITNALSLQNLSTNTHVELYNALTKLGYKSPFFGFCNGVSMRWLEACFLEEEALFDDKIQKIISKGSEYVQQILTLRETNELYVKKGLNASIYPKHLLELLGFCESVQLYQNPFSYLSLFDKPLWQGSVNEMASVASSDLIHSVDGLVEIYSNPGIYTKSELTMYLDNLAATIECSAMLIDASEIVGMILRNHEHAMALTYTTGKGWVFMDINQYPSIPLRVKQTNVLAEHIAIGFKVQSLFMAFNTSIITVGSNLNLFALKHLLNQLTQNNPITKKEAFRGTNCNNLAIISAQHGHSKIITKLANFGVDLDREIDGIAPIHAAACNGRVDVIRALIPFVNLDKKGKLGQTPLYLAAQQGFDEVVTLLIAHGANPNHTIHNNQSSGFIAARFGQVNVIKVLIKADADLNLPAIASAENWRVFASSHNKEVIKRMGQFIERQLDLNSDLASIAVSAYDIAWIMGHEEIVQLLEPMFVSTVKVNHGMRPLFFSRAVSDTKEDIGIIQNNQIKYGA